MAASSISLTCGEIGVAVIAVVLAAVVAIVFFKAVKNSAQPRGRH
jgi:hypothetical protein